jgi:hypothetical protein
MIIEKDRIFKSKNHLENSIFFNNDSNFINLVSKLVEFEKSYTNSEFEKVEFEKSYTNSTNFDDRPLILWPKQLVKICLLKLVIHICTGHTYIYIYVMYIYL